MKNKQATILAIALLACVGVMCIAYFFKTRSGSDVIVTPEDKTEVIGRSDGANERGSSTYTGWSGTKTDNASPGQGDQVVELIPTPGPDSTDLPHQDEATSPTLMAELDAATTETLAGLEPGMIGVNDQGQKVLIGPNGEEILLDENGNPIDGEEMDGEEFAGVDDDDIPKIDAGVYGDVVRGNEPVEDAMLELRGVSNGYRTSDRTDGNGTYGFSIPAVGEYILTLQSPACTRNVRNLTFHMEGEWIEKDFVASDLDPASGRVIDRVTRMGIVNAEVNVSRQGIYMTGKTTTEDGKFTLDSLDEGDYEATVKGSGYPEEQFDFTIFANNVPTNLEFELDSAPLIGFLYDPSGQPVSKGLVDLYGTGAYNDPLNGMGIYTNMDGSFTLSIPYLERPMNFRVAGFKEGYIPAFSEEIPYNGEIPEYVNVQLEKGLKITAKVVDEDETAIEGAQVTIESGYGELSGIFDQFEQPFPSAISDSYGMVTLSPVMVGKITVSASAIGYTSPEEDTKATISKDGQNIGDLVLMAGPAEGRIYGNFNMFNVNGPVVIDVMHVHAENLTGEGIGGTDVNSSGGFAIDDLPDGDYLLTCSGSTMVERNQYMDLTFHYPFAQPGDPEISLVYDITSSIEFKVENLGGEPVTEFTAVVTVQDYGASGLRNTRLMSKIDFNKTIQTNDGFAILDNLISGTATLTISSTEFGTSEETVDVPVQDVVDAGTIVLSGPANVKGEVTSGSNGLKGVKVQAVAPIGSDSTHYLNGSLVFIDYTDDSGFFKIEGLMAGETDFVFSKSGYEQMRKSDTTLVVNETIDLEDIEMVSAGILTGTVYDPDGQTLDGIRIDIATQTTRTTGGGKFTLDGLPEGTHDLEAIDESFHYQQVTKPVNLVPGEETDIDVYFTQESSEVTVTPTSTPAPTLEPTAESTESE